MASSEGSASMVSRDTSAQEKEIPALRKLQAKYNAVLAENDRLYRDLREEQAQHERYKSAYQRVQDDVQKDQAMLRQLYHQIGPAAEPHKSEEAEFAASASNASDRAKASGPTGSGPDRVTALERDCAYLQAKVESLHMALRRYETSNDTQAAAASPAAAYVAPHSPRAAPVKEKENATATAMASATSAALKVEQERCRRVEEQLTRCHATLRSLRDDAEQKEVYFHQQLTAVQEQNASLLADLDLWVTGEQQMLLSSAFASRVGAAPKVDVPPPLSSSSSSAPPLASPPTPPAADASVRDGLLHELHSMQQYLKDQEEVLTLKERSIEQLEARVRELEGEAARAAVRQSQMPAIPTSLALQPKLLLQVQREAAAAEECVRCFTESHFPRVYVVPPSTTSAPLHDGASPETSAEVSVRYIHDVLRYVREVLSLEGHTSKNPKVPHGKPDAALRSPPFTVVQPTVASSPSYQSGETLSEAAHQLAKLMRRHVQQH